MLEFVVNDDQTQVLVPLRVHPFSHKAVPTLTGNALSYEAGTVLYGHYNMEYLLPGGDKLRLIANHDKKTVQLMLFTHDPGLLKLLPGARPSSLVADAISTVNSYRTRSQSYSQPLSPEQQEKLELANRCIGRLNTFLLRERQLDVNDHHGHEQLRRDVIETIETCRDGNRLLANSPVISEGSLGYILYDAHKAAQHYQFNRVYKVSPQDQMDFTDPSIRSGAARPCFVWDSELHIGHDSDSLDDALRTICRQYQLIPAKKLNNIPANRFEKLEAFLFQLWQDGKEWIEYLAVDTKPNHKTEIEHPLDGISITKITPYYRLQGFKQKGYKSLEDLVFKLINSNIKGQVAQNSKEARQILSQCSNGHWVILPNKQKIILRLENRLVKLRYFSHENEFFPLPEGEDLYTLSQISKRHLYLPERVSLRLKAFISKIPTFFQNFYKSLRDFIVNDLHQDFTQHVHENHIRERKEHEATSTPTETKSKCSLHEALESHGLLHNGETLEQFIKRHINESPYVIARANHPPSPPAYDNPIHRILGVLRHIAGFFVDTSERNPIIGTIAIAAYFYGGGAILAPKALEALLIKLHLHGLISCIEPTQKLAHWMSHGTTSEAISASVTLWQGVVAGGNLDKFFVSAVGILKDDPGEVAIIASLALGLGYGLTKVIPSLQQEMGEFALPNYAALGGKGGAAIYDTIMHPGDDWLLGTCKWFCKRVITLGKLVIAPFVEGYYYGFEDGFINGWKKSGRLFVRTCKQMLAAVADAVFMLLTAPLLELSALLIHVPFRGVTNLLSKLLSTIGNISAISAVLIRFAERPTSGNFLSEFQLSPLYGFSSPFGRFSNYWILNVPLNALSLLLFPPLQLIKNIFVLPLIDISSLVFRIGITIINPLSRITAYGVGTLLGEIGDVWDNSVGLIFSLTAIGLTHLWNWLDNLVGSVKQYLLSAIEIQRGELYHWAFAEEDVRIHHFLTDPEYYNSDPTRLEKTPHPESHCIMSALLNDTATGVSRETSADLQHSKLFQQSERDSATNAVFSPILNQ